MGENLKYNLADYSREVKNIESLKKRIETNKNSMQSGLGQIRKDWTLEGGKAFFDSIDNSWEDSVENCIDVIDDLLKALNDAYKKYVQISNEAANYLKM